MSINLSRRGLFGLAAGAAAVGAGVKPGAVAALAPEPVVAATTVAEGMGIQRYVGMTYALGFIVTNDELDDNLYSVAARSGAA